MHLGLLRAIGFDDLARAQSCNNVVLNFRSYEKINDILATVFTDENTLYKTGLARPDTIDLFKKAMRGFMSRLNQVEIAVRVSNNTLSVDADRGQRICHTTAMECMNSILSHIDRDYTSDPVKPMEYFQNGIDSTPNAMIRNDAVSSTFTFVNFSSIISSGSASLRSRTDDFASGEFPEEYIQQGRNRGGRSARPRR